jgi:hypothetical protein
MRNGVYIEKLEREELSYPEELDEKYCHILS